MEVVVTTRTIRRAKIQSNCHHQQTNTGFSYSDALPVAQPTVLKQWREMIHSAWFPFIASIDVTSRWREDWQSVTVVNSTLVVDPTIRLPGFDLHRRQWSLLNRFRTGQGHCNVCHQKWGFTDNELCDCGEIQTMSHIVNSCPLTKFDGGLLRLHEAHEAAVDWLTT